METSDSMAVARDTSVRRRSAQRISRRHRSTVDSTNGLATEPANPVYELKPSSRLSCLIVMPHRSNLARHHSNILPPGRDKERSVGAPHNDPRAVFCMGRSGGFRSAGRAFWRSRRSLGSDVDTIPGAVLPPQPEAPLRTEAVQAWEPGNFL